MASEKTSSKKKILVTGGAGFIGSHLCRALVKSGFDVICLDNLFTGSKDNIKDLLLNPRFEFVNHDITEPYYNNNISQIYNLACPASPIHYQMNPIKTIKTCTIGTINILGLARANNSKILLASTSEVYGNPKQHPQKETYYGNVNPIGIRSCYDEGKRCAEALFMDYHRQHDIVIKIVRIFNTYGPNMAKNDGRVVSNFINQAIEGLPITIYGDGSQTRSFQYIDDLISGLILMMNSKSDFIGPVNFGNTDEISINFLASAIKNMLKSKSKIIYRNLPEDDPVKRKPDITLAKNKLSWSPKIDLNSGLKKTIKYFMQYEKN